ncbi:AIM24 family protein [Actinomyces sp.]|uniref:AIM24 family protein n=1 Tax=Actinomyces sp. TaxID=29317 RepID=UPI0026DC3473|nr:AIM24 family protein [Actinomyces sp.]MDO4655789.1 AIM24 family protein [Actinomyces sp.]
MVQRTWRGQRLRQLKIVPQTPGLLASGLLNLAVQGQGVVAVPDDGAPLFLDCSRQPTFVDPQAATCWSANLQPQIKSSFKMGALIGRDSGDSFQSGFHDPDSVAIQPSEGQPEVMSP